MSVAAESFLSPSQDCCLTPKQAASFLGITPRLLQQMRRRGDGPKYLKPGHRTVRYPQPNLRQWVATRAVTNTSEARQKGVTR
jgi:predicted DNA-binding transcriptional regulator AlpA